ncbi:hypothetical protein HPO96_12705 [Kribbella sandramycini]|uniref:Uncharacterized protein n=1 Tax=Kribbella sandramycini TaxID=60450 RepID=A0A7Y4P0I6_9ACTN|nr:hypothetical protein [Kribbella sandramycini]MBB6569052.1 hypothetical protein [Kribbella sandramycini]NOL41104.1 hypothetical protein [Kribbella sandramycini]
MNTSPDKLIRVATRSALAAAAGIGLAAAAALPAQAHTSQVVWDAPTQDDCYRLMSKIVADDKYCTPPDGSWGDKWDGYATWR